MSRTNSWEESSDEETYFDVVSVALRVKIKESNCGGPVSSDSSISIPGAGSFDISSAFPGLGG